MTNETSENESNNKPETENNPNKTIESNEQKNNESKTKQESPKETNEDEEGLDRIKGYDVIICGTNLINSIVSCAISLTGKKSILHCDGSFYYGDYDVTFTSLNDLFSWCNDMLQKEEQDDVVDVDTEPCVLTMDEYIALNRNGGLSDFCIHSYSGGFDTMDYSGVEIEIGMKVHVICFDLIGSVISIQNDNNTTTLGIELTPWCLANGKHPILYIPSTIPKDERPTFKYYTKLKSLHEIYHEETKTHNRQFTIDISTNLVLYANGASVQGLLSSNVANYLEFQSIPSLYLLNKDFKLLKVPCSKADVFSSKDLSPMDKRKIMKLSQFALDYGLMKHYSDDNGKVDDEKDGENGESNNEPCDTTEVVTTLNEVRLQTGRSLIRPQNKTTLSLEEYKQLSSTTQDQSFEEFITTKYKITSCISKDIVQYVLGLSMDGKEKFSPGMDSLFYHLNSLGRFGNTAFLCPLYGCGEILQSFCRSSAVHGSISLLRRCPLRILYSTNQDKEKVTTGIVLGADPDPVFTPKTKDKIIPCQYVIVSSQSITHQPSNKRIFKRVSILRSSTTAATNFIMQNYSRCVFILPPKTINDEQNYAIQGILLDSTLHVTPMHYFTLHLTTIIDVDTDTTTYNDDLLNQAVNHLLQILQTQSSSKIYQIHHLSYSVNHPPTTTQQQEYQSSLPINTHPTYRSSMSNITLDEAFHQAKNIFSKICPEDDFLIVSDYLQEKIQQSTFRKDKVDDYDDNEKHLLDSAFQSMFDGDETSCDEKDIE